MTIHQIPNGDHRCNSQDQLGVFTLFRGCPAGAGDVLILGRPNNFVRCVEIETIGRVDGLSETHFLVKPKTICDFDLTQPAPVPGGAMRNAWDKGGAAFKAGAAVSSYPGDKGTAPHKVWLKGYLWEYCSKL